MPGTSLLDLMTPDQVADCIQVPVKTVYGWIGEGILPAARLGRRYRISRLDLELFLQERSTDTSLREALFERVRKIAERNDDIPFEEVERDVGEAVAEVRRSRRG